MNDEEELFAERNEFNFESKLIRNDNKNIYNRLCSIVDDATFVMKIADIMPDLALIANERCGSWYIDRTKKKAYSAYFKSTDGHMHIWDFNIRRNNLHLIPILMSHNGCLIVDSTRKGKRIPDALSKTIPIWCCTVNRAVAKYAGYNSDWDLELHTLPSAVSRSEHAQIEARLNGFVDKLLTSGVDMEHLKNQLLKPLRPIWFTPQSYDALVESPPDFQDASFCPVVCLSASEAVETGYQLRPGYLYVQGSADDEEAWAFGLTHLAFWKHRHDILTNSIECERNVKSIVTLLKNSKNDDDDADNYDGTTNHFAFIKSTLLAIGDCFSGKPPSCWNTFDYVINCCQDEYELNQQHKNYLHLPIPDGKKGQIIFGSSIQKAIDFVHDPIIGNKKILIYCATGKDYSVGILLSILIQYYTLEFELTTTDKPRVDKKMIQHQLVQIISNWEKAAPSRVTLKRINTHFMSHSSHDNTTK